METRFGGTLKAARVDKKITLREISNYLGKTVGYISDIEHGRKNPPDLEMVRKMEAFLGIKSGTLVNLALEIRNKTSHSLSQRIRMRPLLSEVLLRADNLNDDDIRKLLEKIDQAEGK